MLTSGATIKGYLGGWKSNIVSVRHRIVKLFHTEQPNNYTATIVLDNSDNHFTDLDLKGYTGVISWGYHTGLARSAWVANTVYAADAVVVPTTANGYQYICTTAGTSHATTEPTWPMSIGATVTDGTVTWTLDGYSGDEYSKTAPLKAIDMQLFSAPGKLHCYIPLEGTINQMASEPASEDYTPASSNTDHLKDVIAGTAAATSYGFPVYDGVTLSWDSEDTLIDVLVPADGYRVIRNAHSRLERINWCLGWTKEVMRAEADGKLHFINPTVSGTTYAYSYALSSSHPFFGKTYQKPIVRPNYVGVAPPDNTYLGSATDATYTTIMYWRVFVFPTTNVAQADDVAAAIIQRAQLNSQGGGVSLPLMNVGQELWDYVLVTDAREGGSTRTGNIQYIQRTYDASTGRFGMTFRFGGGGNIPAGNALASTRDVVDQTSRESGMASRDELLSVGNALLALIEELMNQVYAQGGKDAGPGGSTARTITFAVEGALTAVANASYEIPVPENMACYEVYINVKVAPTGATIIVDVNLDGTTIFTTQASRPVVAIAATEGVSAEPDVTYLPKNGILSIDIDQIGDVTAGSDLIVEVRCTMDVYR